MSLHPNGLVLCQGFHKQHAYQQLWALTQSQVLLTQSMFKLSIYQLVNLINLFIVYMN